MGEWFIGQRHGREEGMSELPSTPPSPAPSRNSASRSDGGRNHLAPGGKFLKMSATSSLTCLTRLDGFDDSCTCLLPTPRHINSPLAASSRSTASVPRIVSCVYIGPQSHAP